VMAVFKDWIQIRHQSNDCAWVRRRFSGDDDIDQYAVGEALSDGMQREEILLSEMNKLKDKRKKVNRRSSDEDEEIEIGGGRKKKNGIDNKGKGYKEYRGKGGIIDEKKGLAINPGPSSNPSHISSPNHSPNRSPNRSPNLSPIHSANPKRSIAFNPPLVSTLDLEETTREGKEEDCVVFIYPLHPSVQRKMSVVVTTSPYDPDPLDLVIDKNYHFNDDGDDWKG
jgi:hypothetical protein